MGKGWHRGPVAAAFVVLLIGAAGWSLGEVIAEPPVGSPPSGSAGASAPQSAGASAGASAAPSARSSGTVAAGTSASPAGAAAAAHARSHDVNGDGYADLVVGAPGEAIGSIVGAGAVQVIRGSASGPTATGNQIWSQDSAGVAGTAEARDRFGDSVASGDFDADGYADIAIGVPGEAIGTIGSAGMVHVLYGTAAGLTATSGQGWHQDTPGMPGASEIGDRFGGTLAAGDVDGDGFDDLVIGSPGEAIGTVAHAGSVTLLRGSESGLTATGAQAWSQNSTGVADAAEEPAWFEEFGAALAMGDVDGDDRADLVVAAPGEATATGNGAVHVLRGTSTGLTAAGSQFLTAQSTGAGWPPFTQAGFGGSLALADLDDDGHEDLVVGTPLGAVTQGGPPIGTVAVLAGSGTGTFGAAQVWDLDRPDLPGTARATDRFGSALVAGDLTGDGITDVAVGAPWRSVGTVADAGAVYVLIGSAGGPRGSVVEISQDAGTVPGAAELADIFGSSLIAGHHSSATADWLAVGAPGEGVGTTTAAGSVTLLPGSATGPNVGAARALTQDSAGILGAAEDHDWWGTLDGLGVAMWPALPDRTVGRVVTVLPTTARVVALTFDGGASNAGGPAILAALADEQVQATFFLSGAFARAYPASVRAIAAAGHRIGNHTDTHADMTTLALSAQADQVRRAEAAVRPLAGRSTHPWFRFPFGANTTSTVANVNAEGFSVIGWTVDTLGWKGTSGGQTVASVVNRVVSTARPGQIVLMHLGANPDDGTTLDADALPTVITRLKAMGYSFVTVDSALR